MTKRQKQEDRLFAKPPPTDFTWKELISVMRRKGFVESCNDGSHYIFQHQSGKTFRASKPHPSGIMKRYQIDEAKEAICATLKQNGEDDE